ncbi:complex I subunit 5 family protein [Thiomicrospira microaerophila]|uniref:complex I subunit 5 family protein n=1 Tax=Thiomicrospira microaerophila TaxID=406020 RepID=UPI0005C9BDAD|nr:proton-conducting transporter membrane subunit [Thiomicrospira microaerophila]
MSGWLAILVLWPLAMASLIAIWPKLTKPVALLALLGTGLLSMVVFNLPNGVWALGGWARPLGIGWRLDEISRLMLLLTGVVGMLVSLYAWWDSALPRSFWVLWLGAWGAMNALYLAADVFNIYVTLELLGLSAVALVAISLKAGALQAAMRYLLVSLLGSMLFLLGVALLYGQYGQLDILALATQMEPSFPMLFALVVMSVGLMAKTAVFPLHSWLPLAHGRAPAAVSAILSALVIKASFYLLMRLWLEVFAPIPTLALVYGVWLMGSVALLWGAWQALSSQQLKPMVAWSTVAQVGYLVIGLGLLAHPNTPTGINTPEGWQWGLLWLMMAHALAKSAMFLAAGNLQQAAGHDRISDLGEVMRVQRKTLFAFGIAGVSLAGLPVSAGFLAKWWLLELGIFHQAWWLVMVMVVASLLTAGYVFRVLNVALNKELKPVIEHAPVMIPIHAGRQWVVLILACLGVLAGLQAQWLWGG